MCAASAPLRRIVGVIDVVAAAPNGLSLSDIATQLELPLPTAYRIVHSLIDVQYLVGEGRRSQYRLGPRVLRLTQLTLGQDLLRTLCTSAMQVLADHFECSCFVTRLVNKAPQLVVTVLPRRSKRTVVHPGHEFPINAASSGKVLFAFQPDLTVRSLANYRFRKYRPKTIVEPDRVYAMLKQVRRDGYAVSDDELDAGVYAVSVPISVEGVGIMYTLGIVGLRDSLLSKARTNDIVSRLCKGAGLIARSLRKPLSSARLVASSWNSNNSQMRGVS